VRWRLCLSHGVNHEEIIIHQQSKIIFNAFSFHLSIITNQLSFRYPFYDHQSKKAGLFRQIPEKSPLHGGL
jgi:hypothetical protein